MYHQTPRPDGLRSAGVAVPDERDASVVKDGGPQWSTNLDAAAVGFSEASLNDRQGALDGQYQIFPSINTSVFTTMPDATVLQTASGISRPGPVGSQRPAGADLSILSAPVAFPSPVTASELAVTSDASVAVVARGDRSDGPPAARHDKAPQHQVPPQRQSPQAQQSPPARQQQPQPPHPSHFDRHEQQWSLQRQQQQPQQQQQQPQQQHKQHSDELTESSRHKPYVTTGSEEYTPTPHGPEAGEGTDRGIDAESDRSIEMQRIPALSEFSATAGTHNPSEIPSHPTHGLAAFDPSRGGGVGGSNTNSNSNSGAVLPPSGRTSRMENNSSARDFRRTPSPLVGTTPNHSTGAEEPTPLTRSTRGSGHFEQSPTSTPVAAAPQDRSVRFRTALDVAPQAPNQPPRYTFNPSNQPQRSNGQRRSGASPEMPDTPQGTSVPATSSGGTASSAPADLQNGSLSAERLAAGDRGLQRRAVTVQDVAADEDGDAAPRPARRRKRRDHSSLSAAAALEFHPALDIPALGYGPLLHVSMLSLIVGIIFTVVGIVLALARGWTRGAYYGCTFGLILSVAGFIGLVMSESSTVTLDFPRRELTVRRYRALLAMCCAVGRTTVPFSSFVAVELRPACCGGAPWRAAQEVFLVADHPLEGRREVAVVAKVSADEAEEELKRWEQFLTHIAFSSIV